MPKLLIRFISCFLVFALLADPVSASAFIGSSTRLLTQPVRVCDFEVNALNFRALFVPPRALKERLFGSRIIRRISQSLESKPHLVRSGPDLPSEEIALQSSESSNQEPKSISANSNPENTVGRESKKLKPVKFDDVDVLGDMFLWFPGIDEEVRLPEFRSALEQTLKRNANLSLEELESRLSNAQPDSSKEELLEFLTNLQDWLIRTQARSDAINRDIFYQETRYYVARFLIEEPVDPGALMGLLARHIGNPHLSEFLNPPVQRMLLRYRD